MAQYLLAVMLILSVAAPGLPAPGTSDKRVCPPPSRPSIAFGQQQAIAHAHDERSTPEAIKQFNADQLSEVSKQIAGKEDKPADVVFKNIKILNGIPARRLLGIMRVGFAQSLGVSCAHCHVPGQWDKDDKPAKQIARDMWGMMHTIDNDLLKNIAGIKDRNPLVNCTTCHRGQLKPALDLPADEPKK
jgi:hypothetical protein